MKEKVVKSPHSRLLWIVFLASLVMFSPAVITGRALFWGTTSLQFVPWRHLAWQQLADGVLPLWNPYLGMGAPLLANYQSALLYPPNGLFYILEALGGLAWSAWGIGLLAAAHLAWAGLGMARLVRHFGGSPLAQALSAAAYGLSGYLVGRVGFYSMLTSAAWLPWVIGGVVQLGYSHRAGASWPRRLALLVRLALVIALQLLAGHGQTSWYTLLLAGILGAWTACSQDQSELRTAPGSWWRQQFKRVAVAWLLLACASLLALLLAAAQIFPTAEYLAQSQRADQVGYEFAMTYSFWPWRFLTLLAPGMFGSPASGDYWGYANFWEDHVYIGLLPFLLAAALFLSALISGLRYLYRRLRLGDPARPIPPSVGFSHKSPQAGLVAFLLLIAGLAFLLALGDRTPIFPWLYRYVPTFDMFQAPTRFTIWAAFSLAWLAGIGVDRWRRPQGRALYWSRLAVAGAVAITLGAGAAWILLRDVSPTFIRATVIAGMWGVGIGVLNLLAPVKDKSDSDGRRTLPEVAWAFCVLLLLCGDLVTAGWGLNPAIETAFYTQPDPVAGRLRAQIGNARLFLHASAEYNLKFDRFMRFDTFDPGADWQEMRSVLLPNLGLLDGVYSANNFDPLLPARYTTWMERLEAQDDPSIQRALLNLMGVGAVENISSASGLAQYDVLDGGQRWRWVACAEVVADPEAAWDRLAGGQFNLDSAVVLENSAILKPECLPGQPSARLELQSDQPHRLVIQASTPASGWLVLSDTWYPGWLAYVDGQPVPVLRANYLFRAVSVPAGEHRIEFLYRPLSFILGAAVSIVTWIVVLLLLLKLRRS